MSRSRLHTTALDVGLSLYAALLALHPIDEADNFFHLSLGRAVLRAGSRVVPEPTAFADFTEPCVVAEWLWGVLSYGLYRLGGFAALTWLSVALAVISALGIRRLVDAYYQRPEWLPRAALASAVLCCIQCRISVRPQLVLLAGLPFFLLACRAYSAASGPRRSGYGIALAASVALWGQFHGSFVLAPALFVISLLPLTLSRDVLRRDGVTLCLLLAALFTSAYGARVSLFVGSHAAGDAVRYVAEMRPTTWSDLHPLQSPCNFGYLALVLVGLLGAVSAQRAFWRELLLALLGAALLVNANRFLAEAALLAAPWVACTCRAWQERLVLLPKPRITRLLRAGVAASCAGLLAWTAHRMQEQRGPIGHGGLSEHDFPLYAAAALAALPDGAAVMTDYPASAPVGFMADGRLRTYVDGRTPLYFDADDFAVERELMRDGTALLRGIARYDAVAVVVRRDSEACVKLARSWPVALVEPLFTTFVRTPGALGPEQTLRACGHRYIPPESCKDPAAIAASIARVRSAGALEFARYLEAERSARCGGDPAQALAVLRDIAPRARPFAASLARADVELQLATGDYPAARERMLAALARADLGIITTLESAPAGAFPLSDVRTVLTRYVEVAADEADPAARAALAEICVRSGDLECAHREGVRAAARGKRSSALPWLEQHAPTERMRRDAARWQQVLDAEARSPAAEAAARLPGAP